MQQTNWHCKSTMNNWLLLWWKVAFASNTDTILFCICIKPFGSIQFALIWFQMIDYSTLSLQLNWAADAAT